MSNKIKVSAIIPVTERYDDVRELFQAYKDDLNSAEGGLEFIYVLDGEYPEVSKILQELQSEGEPVRILQLAKWFGESVALTTGFDHANGEILITLPAYYQVEKGELSKVVSALSDHDMIVGRRWPREDALLNRLQGKVFHWIFNMASDVSFRDLGCGVRAFHRHVVDEVNLYGDQHRFFPVLATRQGFNVKELKLKQAQQDLKQRIYRPGVYLRRILDILTVFFLVKFTKKPLRFFGLIGSGMFFVGGIFMLYLVGERLIGDVALGDRPALLLSSLLVVLGIQLFGLGLIGELIIFTHAKEIKEYHVQEIVN